MVIWQTPYPLNRPRGLWMTPKKEIVGGEEKGGRFEKLSSCFSEEGKATCDIRQNT